jgi:Recombination endonuclease VII
MITEMACNGCREILPLTDFGPSARQWPRHAQCHACNRAAVQKRRHGLTAEQRVDVAATQGGCRICGHAEPGGKGWVIDHDRSCCPKDRSCSKCRRGVVCQWCNSVLGYAFDRTEILRAAADYLDAPRTCDWHKPIACANGICDSLIHDTDGRNGRTNGEGG